MAEGGCNCVKVRGMEVIACVEGGVSCDKDCVGATADGDGSEGL